MIDDLKNFRANDPVPFVVVLMDFLAALVIGGISLFGISMLIAATAILFDLFG